MPEVLCILLILIPLGDNRDTKLQEVNGHCYKEHYLCDLDRKAGEFCYDKRDLAKARKRMSVEQW